LAKTGHAISFVHRVVGEFARNGVHCAGQDLQKVP
jgi:hypothetical protein